jgi:hypothetical protein
VKRRYRLCDEVKPKKQFKKESGKRLYWIAPRIVPRGWNDKASALLATAHPFHKPFKIFRFAEVTVDGGVADVGHLIQATQCLHH